MTHVKHGQCKHSSVDRQKRAPLRVSRSIQLRPRPPQCLWRQAPAAAQSNSDPLDFGDLLTELDAMAADATNSAAGHEAAADSSLSKVDTSAMRGSSAATRQAVDSSGDGGGSSSNAALDALSRGHVVQLSAQLPEFWLDATPEPAQSGASAAAAAAAEHEHVQKLLQQYANDETSSDSGAEGCGVRRSVREERCIRQVPQATPEVSQAVRKVCTPCACQVLRASVTLLLSR